MAITISGSGITSANIADGTIVNVDVADLAASKLTGALPAISGAALTNLPGGGKVLQVVSTVSGTYVSSTAGSVWLDATLSLSITPTASTSKILVITNEGAYGDCDQDGHNTYGGYRILRGSTSIVESGLSDMFSRGGQAPAPSIGITYLDTPNTTAAVTYKTQVYYHSSSNRSLRINQFKNASITLMEIAQ